MRKAIRKGDPSRTPIRIKRWITHHRRDIPVCPVCNHEVTVAGGKPQGPVAHFRHPPKTGCPIVESGRKPYEVFKPTRGTSAAEIKRVKQYALDHIESIYERASVLCPNLTWKEFLPLLKKATELRCWSYKKFNTGYIPYLLLCCADKFKGTKGSKRPRTIFFVLESGAQDAEFWHLPPSPKKRIWRVVQSTKNLDDIQMVMDEIEPWYRKQARMNLKL